MMMKMKMKMNIEMKIEMKIVIKTKFKSIEIYKKKEKVIRKIIIIKKIIGQKNNGQKNNSQKNNRLKKQQLKKRSKQQLIKDKNDQKDDKNNQKDDINDQKNDKNDEQNDENEKIKDKKDEQNDENVQQKDEQNEKDDKQIENNNDQKEKLIGETIDKPIYRKTIGTFEFGADLKSQCLESKIISEEDICTVGIYGYFNGKQTKIYERKTKINISQLLKYYQYIQHNFVKKSQSLKEKIEQNIQTVMTAFNRVLDKSEEMIDVQKNPILKEIYKTLDNDELGIIKLLNTFESLINTTLKNVNKLIEDPLNTIKERTFSFLSDKKIHIQDTVTSLYNYFKNKFMTIKNFIETNITIGIPQKIKDQINFFMNNYEQIIYQLLEQPLTKLMNETKQLILKKTNEIFNRTLEIDKIANMNAEQLIQDGLSQLKNKISKTTIQMQEEVQKYVKIPNQFKKRLTGKFLMDMMQKLIKQVIQKISQNIDFTKLLKQTLQKGLSVMQVSVQELLNKIPTNNDNNNLKDIQILFQENDEIVSLTVDLFSGFSEFKQEVIKLVNTLKKLQQGSMLKSISQFAQKIVGFPTEIAKQLKQQGIQMIDKIKNLGIRIKENIIQWKDGIVNTSKQLVLEVKNIYKEIKQFLVKPNFPKSSDDYYKTPLFDEAKEIIQKVKESINLNFDPITTTLDRMKGIPDLFLKFIQQIKDMGKLTTKYWDQIKLSVGNIKQEGNSLWKMIQSKANQANQKFNSILSKEVSFRFLSRKHILDKNGVLDKEYRILYGKEIIDTIQNNILVGDSLDEQLKNLNLNNQLVSVEDAALDLSQNGINQVLDSLSQFKSKTSSENQNIDSLYSDLIKQLLDYFTYEKQVKIPAYRYPIDYSYTYVTSVGIGIKIMLRAEWQLDYDLGIKFKQAILTLSAGLSTRVTVSGQIAIDVGFTEVGGAADGVLFDTGLTVGLTLEPLNKFKGSIYLDGQFTPYYFKIGAYKGKIDLKEQQNCLDKKKGKENEKENDKGQGKKRMLDGENKEIIDVKSTISDILEDNAQPQKPIVIDTGANECKIDIYGLPQRDWILGPLEFKGETYKKRFLEFKW
ncbi:hypothetical protein IMG5_075230 [Ichthyophthirius multifiliis]|uniref:Uncharacterized protein n=1 Tax=Ichthyophthirius multifiliis TaxID=5932 RepID=G0QQ44_ICHMU|nr:hypothetical protein IMG5_075230 [Ichthyophthirius multifiliis]EGR32658.1 hypothetical protein IMG5_075230 [Ichthyophthirius multifiliis]|eukprot:XP_004036644.1 hypothetical protein IMG5_075230 [Ichthyophthirius multifiliis]